MVRSPQAADSLQAYVTRQAERRPQATALVDGELRVGNSSTMSLRRTIASWLSTPLRAKWLALCSFGAASMSGTPA